MKNLIFTIILLITFPILCSAETLTVAVAANVQFAFEEIKTTFEKINPEINIRTVIGSSGKIAAQIEHGAPFDIFFSADAYYPQILQKNNLTLNTPKVYAYGILILWTRNDINLSHDLSLLTTPNIKKIALPNPKTAPYGHEALNVLKHLNLYKKTSSKFVYGENVAQTNQFIFSKACDIGFTAKSAVLIPQTKNKGRWIEIPPETYDPIQQTAVILKKRGNIKLPVVQKFFNFIFSSDARKIFKKYGYMLPDKNNHE